MTLPIERFKDAYKNWRYNPFSAADMAVDAEEDNLVIPAGSPFVVQLLEVPRYNDPTSASVRAYGAETDVDANSASGQKVLNVTATAGFSASDKVVINRGGAREEEGVIDTIQAGVSLTLLVDLTYTHTAAQADDVEEYIEYTEVGTSPTQGQYRVDYPPADGEGTGLVEFNQNDASKVVRVNYKATGSPALEETLDTKVSFPAGDPVDNQIIAFDTGAPAWQYNPRAYFHEGPAIYHASGEDESCLLFRFKRRAEDQKVALELKGAKLHQGLYTELAAHDHGVGTLAAVAVGTHTHALSGLVIAHGGDHGHAIGTLAVNSGGGHLHAKGTLAGSQPTHNHADTFAVDSGGGHGHTIGTLGTAADGGHLHAKGTLAGSQSTHGHSDTFVNVAESSHTHEKGGIGATTPAHDHGLTGSTAAEGDHSHVINTRSHRHSSTSTSNGLWTGYANGCATPTGADGGHSHNKGTFVIGNRSLTITVSGTSAAGSSHNHALNGSVSTGGGNAVTIAGSTASVSDHSHTVTGTVASVGNHGHGLSGAVSQGGNDAVTIAGNTASAVAHGHGMSGTVADVGTHTHGASGGTIGQGGGHGHSLSGTSASQGVAAKTYGDSLKVAINGVDRTTEILALTSLTQFGDGSAGHAFNATGSGEMEISSLVAAAQMHEIKVTAPVVGNGSRVLLHLELY